MKKVLYTMGVLTLAVSAFTATAQASPNGAVYASSTELSYGSQPLVKLAPQHRHYAANNVNKKRKVTNKKARKNTKNKTKTVVSYNRFGKVVKTIKKTRKGKVVQIVRNNRYGNKVKVTQHLNKRGKIVKRFVKTIKQPRRPAHHASHGHNKNYTVKRGDTLNRIAARFHTTVKHLMRINNLRSAHIYVGQRVKV